MNSVLEELIKDMSPEEKKEQYLRLCPDDLPPEPQEQKPRLTVVTVHELLTKDLPPREVLLDPWLLSASLNMIHAWRGVGKTWFTLWIAYALASGGECMGWKADKPRGVLYIDGEMPATALQERIAAIGTSMDNEVLDPELFRILTPDLQEEGMPDLGTPEGQALIDSLVTAKTEVIIIDNLSSLVRSGKENEAEGWLCIQSWSLKQRSAGRSVIFVHHSGKGGQQRGTSKREDLLDCVISLKHPSDYDASEGARFEVNFDKGRHLFGKNADAFEAVLVMDDNDNCKWATKGLKEATFDRVVTLANQGLKPGEIAAEIGIHKSTVSRHLEKGRGMGLIRGDSR
jgi:hypothetical protein